MSFGKRGEEPSAQSARPSVRPIPLVAPPAKKVVDLKLDKSFVAMALGVVVLSAGGAMAAPSIFSWVDATISGNGPARPIGTVIAGLDRNQAKAALAHEAFPDQAGRAFMASLEASFPKDHDKLLDSLADKALQGGDRDVLIHALDEWTVDFAPRNLSAIGRTGAEGFDEVLGLASDGLKLLQQAGAGNCTVATLQRLTGNPASLSDLGAYGSEGYKLSMRANRTLVELAAKGRNAPSAVTTLRQEDERALQSAFFAMMQDPQIMSLLGSSMQQQAGMRSVNVNAAANIDICQLGRTVVVKLKNLPSGTKSRLWAMIAQQARFSL